MRKDRVSITACANDEVSGVLLNWPSLQNEITAAVGVVLPVSILVVNLVPLCKYILNMDRLGVENDILRGIATKIMPCHYCGAGSMSQCKVGFPGCALADDVMVCESTLCSEYRSLKDKYDKLVKAVHAFGEVLDKAAQKESVSGEG